MLVFDVNTVAKLSALDGQVFLDETEDTYCVWRTEYRRGLCTYYVDLFRQQGDGVPDRDDTFDKLINWVVGIFIVAGALAFMSALGLSIAESC